MAATYTQPEAREAFLRAVDGLVQALGRQAAYRLMLQATFATGAEPPPPLTRKKLRNLTPRQCAEAHAEAMRFMPL